MRVTEHLQKAQGKTLFSFEVLPPLRGQTISNLYQTIDTLVPYAPAFIDVTSHREEYVYKTRENGLLEKITTRKRPGTVGICAAIQYKYRIDTVPHIICGGFSKEETEYALIDLNYLGIDNVLVLRGDPIKSEGRFVPDPRGHAYASELIEQVALLNRGKYLHEETEHAIPTHFCIGVAGYPEKHYEAPNLTTDIHFLKAKIDGGADYVVTQMFFDNRHYFNFVEKCRLAGITVPIIPGIRSVVTKKQLNVIPQIFNVDLPEELVDSISKCTDEKAVTQCGIEWTIAQCQELLRAGVPCIHFYTLGKAKNTEAVVKAIF